MTDEPVYIINWDLLNRVTYQIKRLDTGKGASFGRILNSMKGKRTRPEVLKAALHTLILFDEIVILPVSSEKRGPKTTLYRIKETANATQS